jgi:hypothetical protein
MRLLVAALIVSAVVVLGIAAFQTRALSPGPSNGPAQGIVWKGQTFATRAAFARWLRSHGTSYRIWARSHPAQAGLTPRGQKSSRGDPRLLAGIAASLAALALGVALVRRRWPDSGAAAAHLIEVGALRGAAAVLAGARTTGRWAIPLAAAATSRARRGLGRSAAYLNEVVAPRSAASALAGTRATRRWAALTAQRSRPVATAAAGRARTGTGVSAARLEIVALRAAAAAKAGARRTRRWAALTAQRSAALATGTMFSARRQRSELVWYVAMALLAAGIGVVVTVSLNGG